MALPKPIIERVGRVFVVRDDALPGGTKRRALPVLLTGAREFVYASPVYGYAQIALAHAAKDAGVKATVLCAKRKTRHARTEAAAAAGARIIEIPVGYLSVVQARAREYCAVANARLLPFGLDAPPFLEALAGIARRLPVKPAEVWSVAGSGVLTRALQRAWPAATFYAVQIGAAPRAGRAQLLQAPEAFEADAQQPPPFPSCSNYDAKAWRFIHERASQDALFWNVGA